SGIWPTAFVADQSLARQKSRNGGANRRRWGRNGGMPVLRLCQSAFDIFSGEATLRKKQGHYEPPIFRTISPVWLLTPDVALRKPGDHRQLDEHWRPPGSNGMKFSVSPRTTGRPPSAQPVRG